MPLIKLKPKAPEALHPIEASHLHARRERVFLILAGLFLGSLTMLNILGITRFIVLASWGTVDGEQVWRWGEPISADPYAWTFALAAGVLPYPITFLCTDFISEFYGRRRANFVVFVGLLLNLWVVFILWAATALPGLGGASGSDGRSWLDPDRPMGNDARFRQDSRYAAQPLDHRDYHCHAPRRRVAVAASRR